MIFFACRDLSENHPQQILDCPKILYTLKNVGLNFVFVSDEMCFNSKGSRVACTHIFIVFFCRHLRHPACTQFCKCNESGVNVNRVFSQIFSSTARIKLSSIITNIFSFFFIKKLPPS